MNEKIKQLYHQSLREVYDYAGSNTKPGEYYSNYKTVLDHKKFAELIVRECAGVCEWRYSHKHKDNSEGAFEAIACSDAILEHFEIEELCERDSECPLCGHDGGTTCGMPGCQY